MEKYQELLERVDKLELLILNMAESKTNRKYNNGHVDDYLHDEVEKTTKREILSTLNYTYTTYQNWCNIHNLNPLNKIKFGIELEKEGFIKKSGGQNITKIYGGKFINVEEW